MSSSSNNNIMDACGFRVSNKETAGKKKECDSSNISNSSCSGGNRKMKRMMMVHHNDNQHRPSPSYANCCGDVTGPTWNASPSSNTYHAMASGLVSGSSLKTLQPFDIATTATTEGVAASMGFPFTNAQWKELERQAMIYKYMMASVPVPPDLLFPITRNSSAPLGSGLNLIRFSNGGDPEPGRCRRTDGKKWRCSRDVAPDQKYCERHLHRGRPRSRKHVELPANKKKSRLKPNPNTISSNNNSNSNNNLCPSPFQFPGSFTQCHRIQSPEAANFQSFKEQRCMDWMMKGEHLQTHSSAGAEWQHLMQQQTGIQVNNSSVLTLHYLEQPLNLNSFTDFSSGDDQFINSELVSLEKQTPRGFIDAWSNEVSNEEHNGNNGAKSFVSSGGNLTLSPLSLSMGGKNAIDGEMGQVLMGLGLGESGQDHENNLKPPLSSWLKPVPWAVSAPGGPLAEVLRPSTVTASGSYSPSIGNDDSGIPRLTAVSSPSGVLQKTLASFSESSGSSSPTPATSRTNKPEVALLWLSQGKLESSS